MSITIGKTQFSTRKPRDLDERLLATTGCNASENLALISANALPGRIAAALRPFLPDDAPGVAELAVLIETALAEEGNTLIADAKKLFAAADVEPAVTNEKPD
jgi:hypothetical protein